MKRKGIVVLGLLFLGGNPLAGQWVAQDLNRSLGSTEYVSFGGIYPSPYTWASPYWGTVYDPRSVTSGNPTGPQVTLYCADAFHYASSSATGVAVTSLSGTQSMASTRLGDAAMSLQYYQQTAYLAGLFESQAPSSWNAIHAAIWSISSPRYVPAGGLFGIRVADLVAPSQTAVAGSGYGFADWYVLTDLRAYDSDGAYNGTGIQEYLVCGGDLQPSGRPGAAGTGSDTWDSHSGT